MSDLVKYLRAHMAPDRPCRRSEQDIACGQAADELDRLNAQALELCAEMSGLRRRLADATALITLATGINLTGTGVPALPLAIRERMDAWLRPADSAPAVQTTCQHDMQLPDPTVTVTRWGTAECHVCAMVWHLPTETVAEVQK